MFGDLARGNRWADIGTGSGGILDLLAPASLEAVGVEPHDAMRTLIASRGHDVVASVDELSSRGGESFNLVTMFHVLEHLHDPIGILRQISRLMNAGSKLIIEVPHAKDALLLRYASPEFRHFTMWSEHLVLHTKTSLEAVIRASGYDVVEMFGVQRYPLANHLYWLSQGQPGGQDIWRDLVDPMLDSEYERLLRARDESDTIIAIAHPRATTF